MVTYDAEGKGDEGSLTSQEGQQHVMIQASWIKKTSDNTNMARALLARVVLNRTGWLAMD